MWFTNQTETTKWEIMKSFRKLQLFMKAFRSVQLFTIFSKILSSVSNIWVKQTRWNYLQVFSTFQTKTLEIVRPISVYLIVLISKK